MKLNLKLVGRNLLHNKSSTFLNVTGLTIALTCVFAAIVWIKNEFSYDKQLPEADRIYRLTFETSYSGNTLHFARCNQNWISQLPGSFPQIDELIRLEPYRHTALKINENKFYSDRVFATDSNFFQVFGIKLISGEIENVLNRPYSAVISASIASKCYGNENPVGQTFLMSGEYDDKKILFTITGVMKDSPASSHIHFDAITSFARPQEPPGWAYVYLLLKKGATPENLLAGLPAFINKVAKSDVQKYIKPYLQKVTDIHLYSNKDREVEQNGNISRIWLFITISVILLLISLTNYFNLNKARLFILQKSIRIQRINGAGNGQIVVQSFAESAICVILALLIALNIVDWFGNFVAPISGVSLLPGGFSELLKVWPLIILITAISIAAGSLPVVIYVLSGKKSLPVFRESISPVSSRFSSYAVLMILQFCMSIVLLVATVTIYQQKRFILSQSMGKMRSDILVFKRQNWEIRAKYSAFRVQALQNPFIKSVTASMEEPGGETVDALQVESPEIDDSHKENPLFVLSVEDNFINFFDLRLMAGRNFSTYNPARKGEDYILNETAVKKLGWTVQEAIGRSIKIKFDVPDIFYGGTVVGVVRDFNFTTIKQEIKPYILFQKPIFYLCFMVQIDSARKEEAIAGLKKIWDQELPDYPFQFELLSDLYKTTYQKELSQAKLTVIFSIMAIIIICLGLFSVSSIMVNRRTKEIGIRKVNGSTTGEILILLNSKFLQWLIIAFIISCPVAWYLMHLWLDNFVYKTDLKWWWFAVSGLLIVLVALLTVTVRSWQAAVKNPVEALRYE
jgi:putative ABC transport system permease protein